jgi:hypothetical protein
MTSSKRKTKQSNFPEVLTMGLVTQGSLLFKTLPQKYRDILLMRPPHINHKQMLSCLMFKKEQAPNIPGMLALLMQMIFLVIKETAIIKKFTKFHSHIT